MSKSPPPKRLKRRAMRAKGKNLGAEHPWNKPKHLYFSRTFKDHQNKRVTYQNECKVYYTLLDGTVVEVCEAHTQKDRRPECAMYDDCVYLGQGFFLKTEKRKHETTNND